MKRDRKLIRDRLASIGRSFCQWHKGVGRFLGYFCKPHPVRNPNRVIAQAGEAVSLASSFSTGNLVMAKPASSRME